MDRCTHRGHASRRARRRGVRRRTDFLDGDAPALLKPIVEIDGVAQDLAAGTMAWERASSGFRPSRARSATSSCAARCSRRTAATPISPAPSTPLRSRAAAGAAASVRMEGTLGHRQLRVRSARPVGRRFARRRAGPKGLVLLEGSAQPGLVALAVTADGAADDRDRRATASRSRGRCSCPREGRRTCVLRRRRSGARRRGGDGRGAASPWVAFVARRHARRAPAARAEHRHRGRRPADQPEPALRVLLRRGAGARRRALLPRAHARALARAPA